MNRNGKLLGRGAAALAAAALVFAGEVRFENAGSGATHLSVSLVTDAQAFNPVQWVWEKFRKGVLDKVWNFIKSPIEKAKNALKSKIDGVIAGLKNVFMEKVLMPAAQWALEKVFPGGAAGLAKVKAAIEKIIGKVERLADIADRYTEAVDAVLQKAEGKFNAAVAKAQQATDFISKFNLEMLVDMLIEYAQERVAEFVRSKTIGLLDKAYGVIEVPINIAQKAAVGAISTIPIVGGVLGGVVDFLITEGLKLIRKKGFEFIADQAVKLADKVVLAIGGVLKKGAGALDNKFKPIIDKFKGFLSKAMEWVGPIKNAFAKVNAGLQRVKGAIATVKNVANTAKGVVR